MVADIKIEVWAYKLLRSFWINYCGTVLADVIEIYKDECLRDDSYLEECDEEIINAISCRAYLLDSYYYSKISIPEIERIQSLSEVCEYLTSKCDEDGMCVHLTVFQRMFVTFSYASVIYVFIHEHCGKRIDIVRYSHIVWAMYFDKFTNEFYEKGGWSELKHEVKSSKMVFEFLRLFPYRSSFHRLKSVKEATFNYHRFKKSFISEELNRGDSVDISKLWIKFQVEHFESYINILPISHETSEIAYEVELSIKEIKLLLNNSKFNSNDELSTDKYQSSTLPTDILYSEFNTACEKLKFSQDKEANIQSLPSEHDLRIINKEFVENTEYQKEIIVNSNTDKQSEFLNTIDGKSASYTETFDFNGIAPEPFMKDRKSNEMVKCVGEKKIIKNTQKDLRDEQNDPEINRFLNHILVLGNKSAGVESSAFRSNGETPVLSQENSYKERKRSKKKKSRK